MKDHTKLPFEEPEDKEARALAPFLYSLSKRNCFTVPENYFHLNEVKLNALSSKQEFFQTPENYYISVSERLNQQLSPATSGTMFSRPEEYFNDFQDRLNERLNRKKPAAQPLWNLRLRPVWAIASVFIIAVAAYLIFFPSFSSDSSLHENELAFHSIDKMAEDIELDLITEAWNESTTSNPIEDHSEIEDFLLNTNLDLNELINELEKN
jgi:hypothetical protein